MRRDKGIAKRTRRRLLGAATIEYGLATAAMLGALLTPFGDDSMSVKDRVVEAVKLEHSGYLYAASTPTMPRVDSSGGGVPDGDGSGGSGGGSGSTNPGEGNDDGTGAGGGTGPGTGGEEGDSGGGSGGDDGPGNTGGGSGGGTNPDNPGTDDPGDDTGSTEPNEPPGGGTDGPDNGEPATCTAQIPDGSSDIPIVASTNEGASQPTSIAATHVGNPIHVVTGNKYQREVDLAPLPGVQGLSFIRHYNSRSHHKGVLSNNWRHLYETRLYAKGDRLYLWQADGRRIDFTLDQDRNGVRRYHAAQYSDGTLTAGKFGYEWRWRDGTVLAFDRDARLLSMTDARGNATRLSYDRRSHLIKISDSRDRSLQLNYNKDGRLAFITDPGGHQTHYGYDADGTLSTVSYPDGITRTYQYEDPHDHHNLTGITQAGIRVATWAYDNDGRATLSMHADGTDKVKLKYGDSQTQVTDASGRISIYAVGRLSSVPIVKSIRGPGCSSCSMGDAVYIYDDTLRIKKVETASGRVALFEYDQHGRLWRLGRQDPGRAVEWKLRYGYRDESREIAEIGVTSVKPGSESVLTIRYDSPGHPVESTEKGFAPLPNGQFAEILRKQKFSSTRSLLTVDGYRSDVEDRTQAQWSDDLLQVLRYPDGYSLTVVKRDESGRPTRVKASNFSLNFVYDSRGRLQSVTGDSAATVSRGQNKPGPTPKRAPPASVDRSRMIAGVRTVVDVRGNATRQGVDDFGRTAFVDSPDAGLIQYAYDEAGNLISKTNADGAIARFKTNIAGRPMVVSMPDQEIRFAWQGSPGSERLVDIKARNYQQHYQYDAKGHLIESLQAVAGHQYRLRYRYDELGRLVSKRLPDGRSIGYRYRLDGRGKSTLAAMVESRWLGVEKSLVGMQVEETDNATRQDWVAPNGLVSTSWYRGRELQRLMIASLHDLRYRYDPRGRIIGIDDGSGIEQRYRFDTKGRLDMAITPWALYGYRYDANGNRTRLNVNGWKRHYLYAADSNRLTGIGDSLLHWQAPMKADLQDAAYRSDESEARTLSEVSHSGSGGIRRYGPLRLEYEANGQLQAIYDGSRLLARYVYDSRAQRISKKIHGRDGRFTDTHFLYEDGQLLGEADGSGRILRQYVYLHGVPVAVLLQDETFSVHSNHLGAPISVTDKYQRQVWSARYAPFGEALVDEDPDHDGQRFEFNLRLPGQYHDVESGLYYNHHRYYDPQLGRYLSSDPLGLTAGPNTFAYAASDPVNNIDPSGLLLFAFDGTKNSDRDPENEWTNVVHFRDAYFGDEGELAIDAASGHGAHWYYITGAGEADARSGIGASDLDTALGTNTGARVIKMGEYFLEYLGWMERNKRINTVLNLDIVGFSRGAAQARIFANFLNAFLTGKSEFMVVNGVTSNDVFDFETESARAARAYLSQSCIEVKLRFLGLWDTVPHIGYKEENDSIESYGNSGDAYLAIPYRVQATAHAVSVNENREIFDSLSVLDSPDTYSTIRVERGFLGAHADIGGGYADGDLSNVAMAWMVEQALLQGVPISKTSLDENDFLRVQRPKVHDQVYLAPDSVPNLAYSPGRTFRYLDRGVQTDIEQKHWKNLGGGLDYGTSLGFIEENIYMDTTRFNDHKNLTELKKVDGTFAYAKWLEENYDLIVPITEVVP